MMKEVVTVTVVEPDVRTTWAKYEPSGRAGVYDPDATPLPVWVYVGVVERILASDPLVM
jgi:hypothetical protein